MRTIITAAIILFSASSASIACGGGDFKFCSKVFYARGECSGLDGTPIFTGPWEESNIAIAGVTIGLNVAGQRWRDWLLRQPVNAYAFAGNSVNPDVMALQVGSGSTTVMYPEGRTFFFPADGSKGEHLDLHVACSGAQRFEAWLVLYYTFEQTAPHLK
jgi:hypothetical protein